MNLVAQEIKKRIPFMVARSETEDLAGTIPNGKQNEGPGKRERCDIGSIGAGRKIKSRPTDRENAEFVSVEVLVINSLVCCRRLPSRGSGSEAFG